VLDTSILVALTQSHDAKHHAVHRELQRHKNNGQRLVLCQQVLYECMSW